MSFAGSLSYKELLRSFGDLLLSLLDVLLSRLYGRMSNKTFRRHDIFGSLVVVGRLRDSKIATLDVQLVFLEEFLQLLDPFVCWILANTWLEHFIFILCVYL